MLIYKTPLCLTTHLLLLFIGYLLANEFRRHRGPLRQLMKPVDPCHQKTAMRHVMRMLCPREDTKKLTYKGSAYKDIYFYVCTTRNITLTFICICSNHPSSSYKSEKTGKASVSNFLENDLDDEISFLVANNDSLAFIASEADDSSLLRTLIRDKVPFPLIRSNFPEAIFNDVCSVLLEDIEYSSSNHRRKGSYISVPSILFHFCRRCPNSRFCESVNRKSHFNQKHSYRSQYLNVPRKRKWIPARKDYSTNGLRENIWKTFLSYTHTECSSPCKNSTKPNENTLDLREKNHIDQRENGTKYNVKDFVYNFSTTGRDVTDNINKLKPSLNKQNFKIKYENKFLPKLHNSKNENFSIKNGEHYTLNLTSLIKKFSNIFPAGKNRHFLNRSKRQLFFDIIEDRTQDPDNETLENSYNFTAVDSILNKSTNSKKMPEGELLLTNTSEELHPNSTFSYGLNLIPRKEFETTSKSENNSNTEIEMVKNMSRFEQKNISKAFTSLEQTPQNASPGSELKSEFKFNLSTIPFNEENQIPVGSGKLIMDAGREPTSTLNEPDIEDNSLKYLKTEPRNNVFSESNLKIDEYEINRINENTIDKSTTEFMANAWNVDSKNSDNSNEGASTKLFDEVSKGVDYNSNVYRNSITVSAYDFSSDTENSGIENYIPYPPETNVALENDLDSQTNSNREEISMNPVTIYPWYTLPLPVAESEMPLSLPTSGQNSIKTTDTTSVDEYQTKYYSISSTNPEISNTGNGYQVTKSDNANEYSEQSILLENEKNKFNTERFLTTKNIFNDINLFTTQFEEKVFVEVEKFLTNEFSSVTKGIPSDIELTSTEQSRFKQGFTELENRIISDKSQNDMTTYQYNLPLTEKFETYATNEYPVRIPENEITLTKTLNEATMSSTENIYTPNEEESKILSDYSIFIDPFTISQLTTKNNRFSTEGNEMISAINDIYTLDSNSKKDYTLEGGRSTTSSNNLPFITSETKLADEGLTENAIRKSTFTPDSYSPTYSRENEFVDYNRISTETVVVNSIDSTTQSESMDEYPNTSELSEEKSTEKPNDTTMKIISNGPISTAVVTFSSNEEPLSTGNYLSTLEENVSPQSELVKNAFTEGDKEIVVIKIENDVTVSNEGRYSSENQEDVLITNMINYDRTTIDSTSDTNIATDKEYKSSVDEVSTKDITKIAVPSSENSTIAKTDYSLTKASFTESGVISSSDDSTTVSGEDITFKNEVIIIPDELSSIPSVQDDKSTDWVDDDASDGNDSGFISFTDASKSTSLENNEVTISTVRELSLNEEDIIFKGNEVTKSLNGEDLTESENSPPSVSIPFNVVTISLNGEVVSNPIPSSSNVYSPVPDDDRTLSNKNSIDDDGVSTPIANTILVLDDESLGLSTNEFRTTLEKDFSSSESSIYIQDDKDVDLPTDEINIRTERDVFSSSDNSVSVLADKTSDPLIVENNSLESELIASSESDVLFTNEEEDNLPNEETLIRTERDVTPSSEDSMIVSDGIIPSGSSSVSSSNNGDGLVPDEDKILNDEVPIDTNEVSTFVANTFFSTGDEAIVSSTHEFSSNSEREFNPDESSISVQDDEDIKLPTDGIVIRTERDVFSSSDNSASVLADETSDPLMVEIHSLESGLTVSSESDMLFTNKEDDLLNDENLTPTQRNVTPSSEVPGMIVPGDVYPGENNEFDKAGEATISMTEIVRTERDINPLSEDSISVQFNTNGNVDVINPNNPSNEYDISTEKSTSTVFSGLDFVPEISDITPNVVYVDTSSDMPPEATAEDNIDLNGDLSTEFQLKTTLQSIPSDIAPNDRTDINADEDRSLNTNAMDMSSEIPSKKDALSTDPPNSLTTPMISPKPKTETISTSTEDDIGIFPQKSFDPMIPIPTPIDKTDEEFQDTTKNPNKETTISPQSTTSTQIPENEPDKGAKDSKETTTTSSPSERTTESGSSGEISVSKSGLTSSKSSSTESSRVSNEPSSSSDKSRDETTVSPTESSTIPFHFTIDADYDEVVGSKKEEFETSLSQQLAVSMRIPFECLQNLQVSKGSVEVDFNLVPNPDNGHLADENALKAAADELKRMIDNGQLTIKDLDGNTVVVVPIDPPTKAPPGNASEYTTLILGVVIGAFILTIISVAIAAIIIKRKANGGKRLTPIEEVRSKLPSYREIPFQEALFMKGSSRNKIMLGKYCYDTGQWLGPGPEPVLYHPPDSVVYTPPTDTEIRSTPRPPTAVRERLRNNWELDWDSTVFSR